MSTDGGPLVTRTNSPDDQPPRFTPRSPGERECAVELVRLNTEFEWLSSWDCAAHDGA
jgi:hypothetical protein